VRCARDLVTIVSLHALLHKAIHALCSSVQHKLYYHISLLRELIPMRTLCSLVQLLSLILLHTAAAAAAGKASEQPHANGQMLNGFAGTSPAPVSENGGGSDEGGGAKGAGKKTRRRSRKAGAERRSSGATGADASADVSADDAANGGSSEQQQQAVAVGGDVTRHAEGGNMAQVHCCNA
jgi:hypothetical protein